MTKLREPVRTYVVTLFVFALMASACGSRSNDQGATSVGANNQQQPAAQAPAADAGAGQSTAAPAADSGTASAAPSAGGTATAGAGTGTAAPSAKTGAAASATPGAAPKTAASPKTAAGSSNAAPSASGKSGTAPGGGAAKTAPQPGQSAPPAGGSISVPGPASQGVTDTEIKVGVLAPLSGYAAFLGQEEFDGVKAFLEDVNAKGGVGGKKYRVIAADTRWEPATEAIGARRLIEQEKVFAIFTTWSDSIGSYVASKGIPDFAFGIAPPAFASKWPNVYPIGFNTVDQILNMAYLQTQVLKKPIKSVAIVYETANIPWGPWVDYAKHAWEQFGVQVKSMDRFNLSDGDCTQLVLKVQSENVDFWQVGNSLGWPLCQQAMTRQGYTPPQGRGGPYTDDILWGNQMAQGYEGVYAQANGVQIGQNHGQPYPYVPSGIAPEVDHYVDSMKKYSPRSGTDAILEGIWTQSFWSQAKLLHDGIRAQNGSITWKGVNQWIQSQTRWDSGLTGVGNFTPNCKQGVSQTWLYQYHWNAAKNTVEEGDWHPFGGPHPTPPQYALVPGKGECYMAAMADAKI